MFCVEILMHKVSLTHSCLYVLYYINNACNFISIHQQGLVVRFLTEPKLQSL